MRQLIAAARARGRSVSQRYNQIETRHNQAQHKGQPAQTARLAFRGSFGILREMCGLDHVPHQVLVA